MAREDFAAQHGASSSDLDLVADTLSDLGAWVIESDAASRQVRVPGSGGLLGGLFGTSSLKLEQPGPGGTAAVHRHRTGSLVVPALDDRPRACAQFIPAAATPGSRTPTELYSDAFAVPSWRAAVVPSTHPGKKHPRKKERGAPDVSGVADPHNGYNVRVDGKDLVVGGTCAIAPLWAALIGGSRGQSTAVRSPAAGDLQHHWGGEAGCQVP